MVLQVVPVLFLVILRNLFDYQELSGRNQELSTSVSLFNISIKIG